jgi:hypothetical protein
MSGKVMKKHIGDPIINKRAVEWGKISSDPKESTGEFLVNLGAINHSGNVPEAEVKVERSKKSTIVRKKTTKDSDIAALSDQDDKYFIHFIVRNNVDGKEIGDSKIELDELIDINLRDLAKEYCVCLNRSHILE